ncbi:hypothetical protein [Microvirga terrestris]|uniref:Copper-binding protein n=1 Tax=Microvirga terrestris TaxID=2791024 RepID=A0ABS0HVJ8_9HYPH|nr:hypothetical protein [Microvirga terrestris]MBF9197379.1 hypothetical protein [Microvirga terrestris]
MKHLILALAVTGWAMSASSHEVAKGPNGGPIADSSGHHVEMVAKGSELVLFLTEADDKPLASVNTKNARAVVQDGGQTATISLQPVEPNKLVGKLAQPLGAGARVVFSATMADGHTVQARFVNN